MSEEEKTARHDKLHRTVTTHTSHTWAAVLVKMLLEQINHRATAKATARLDNKVVSKSYAAAHKRLFCYDYDVRYDKNCNNSTELICGITGYFDTNC